MTTTPAHTPVARFGSGRDSLAANYFSHQFPRHQFRKEPDLTQLRVAPGSVVVVRDEEWVVTKVDATSQGAVLNVRGISDLVRNTEAVFYQSLDHIDVVDHAKTQAQADTSAGFIKSKLWLESILRKAAVPLTSPELAVCTSMLADPLEYQQQAVVKTLDVEKLRPRILLADAVGLGKTLEIGMILSELVARGRGENILIVTPRHVLEQMQQELWTRFALPFIRLDSAGIQRVRQKLPASRNPFTFYNRVIISIDTLKSDRYLAYLRKHHWDAVVIDESHNVTNAGTQNNRLARALAPTTDALILASATPHNGKKESFNELLRLLDPLAVGPDEEPNKDITEHIVIRRHRNSPEVDAEVGDDWQPRQEPRNVLVSPSAAEEAVAEELATHWIRRNDDARPSVSENKLFPWTLVKAYLSSPAALTETCQNRLKVIEKNNGPDTEAAALRRLLKLSQEVTAANSAKFDELVTYLGEIGVSKKSDTRVVIFSERVATLHWLRENLANKLKLPQAGIAVMHGGLGDEEQQQLIEAFKKKHSKLRILVTGDVASEGVNLHSQCHNLIHYDIPWSLIRIEQRNGRVDRYGQRTPPQITTLALDSAAPGFDGDIQVLTKLVEKEHQAHKVLGDVSPLMGSYSISAEENAIRDVLSGSKELSDVAAEVEDTSGFDDVAALMALVSGGAEPQHTDTAEPVNAIEKKAAGAGIFASEAEFLDQALKAHYGRPDLPVSGGGLAYQVIESEKIVSFTPPADLKQRLEVLPQSYLADRNVTERLKLVTCPSEGAHILESAKSDKSATNWPEAHFLGPLHPVIDWVCDRTISDLQRGYIYAITAPVDHPTVLTTNTLLNERGNVVACNYAATSFPHPNIPIYQAFASAHKMVNHFKLYDTLINSETLEIGEQENHYISAAVSDQGVHSQAFMDSTNESARARIDMWTQRIDHWVNQSGELNLGQHARKQLQDLERERDLVASMECTQDFIRPLLLILPLHYQNSQGS